MKKKLCLSLLLFCSVTVFSQNSLQFSQVLTYSGTLATTNGAGDSTATWTVPAGKTWKIESLSGNAYAYTNSYVYFILNGTRIYDLVSTTKPIYMPIWLKAGDAIRIAEYSTSNNYFVTYFISIMEFTITQ